MLVVMMVVIMIVMMVVMVEVIVMVAGYRHVHPLQYMMQDPYICKYGLRAWYGAPFPLPFPSSPLPFFSPSLPYQGWYWSTISTYSLSPSHSSHPTPFTPSPLWIPLLATCTSHQPPTTKHSSLLCHSNSTNLSHSHFPLTLTIHSFITLISPLLIHSYLPSFPHSLLCHSSRIPSHSHSSTWFYSFPPLSVSLT